MPATKYGKYIVSKLIQPTEEPDWNPPVSTAGKNKGGRVLYLDSQIVPGAFYMECVWVMPRPRLSEAEIAAAKKRGPGSHAHDYDEVIAFFGTDHDDPHNLGAEVELWLGDEKHVVTKTSLVFIPAGLKHCPLVFLQVDKPVFHYTTGPGKMYF